MSSSLDVFLLGALELDSALELQERMRAEVASRNDRHGVLLVCEHPPAITIGREGRFSDVLIERDELISRQMDVRWVNRGGGTFLHFPGQLTIGAILPVDRLNLGLGGLKSAFETSLITMAEDLKVPAERSTAAAGACCRCGQFAFIGAGVREGVSHGGMLVNVSLPQDLLDLVRWTDAGTRVTSLSAQRTRATAVSTVRESLIRNLSHSLGYDSYHLYTGHPLLHRTTRKVYVYA